MFSQSQPPSPDDPRRDHELERAARAIVLGAILGVALSVVADLKGQLRARGRH